MTWAVCPAHCGSPAGPVNGRRSLDAGLGNDVIPVKAERPFWRQNCEAFRLSLIIMMVGTSLSQENFLVDNFPIKLNGGVRISVVLFCKQNKQ
jgi:hypothetical protein